MLMAKMRARTNHQRGFTIVELLIVIVVIAILAAITVVAYNGVQQRAKNAQVVSGVNTYIKVIHQYWATYSQSPLVGSGACLGANYPSDQCWTGADGVRAVSSTLDTRLAEFMSAKPTLATSLFSIGINNDMRAGATYEGTTQKIVYYLQGAGQNCGISGASGVTEGGIVTQCAYTFPY